MKDTITITLTFGYTNPNCLGEALLWIMNPDRRWGYTTREIVVPHEDMHVDLRIDKPAVALCVGEDWERVPGVTKVRLLDYDVDVFLYWDGDGTIVFRHNPSRRMIVNYDCKHDDEWDDA